MPSLDLLDCHPALAERFRAARLRYEQERPGYRLAVTCTFRSPDEQFALFQKGRRFEEGRWIVTDPAKRVTNCDGTVIVSKHNRRPARAIDAVVVLNGKWLWDPDEYEPYGALAESEGLVWGGHWTTLKDYPHVELPADVG